MTKKTTYLLGILLTILIGTFLYWKFCCNCCCKKGTGAETAAVVSTVTPDYLNFNLSGNGMNYQCTENLCFKKDAFDVLQPVGDSVNVGIDFLKSVFDKNTGQKLMITGYYTKEEKNTSTFPNLGLARADAARNYFISKGLAANKIDIQGEERDVWSMSGDTLLGPAAFSITEVSAAPAAASGDWGALKEKINANPLVLYFNTSQSENNLTDEQRQKVADITKYLENVADAKVNAVGHTDNVGDRTLNITLGQERADFAKAYLVRKGISEDKIITSSKGPDEPVADNATADGRAKNRRTVVTIQ